MKKVKNILLPIFALLILGCQSKTGDQHIDAGYTYYMDGKLEMAREEMLAGLEKEITNYSKAEVLTILGNIYYDLDQFDSSIIYHQKALEIDSNYVEAWVNMGIAYRLLSDYDAAEICYTKAYEIDPDYPELHASLGALYLLKGDPYLAIEHLNKCIELNPQLAIAHSNLALALATIGDFDKADEELKKAILMGYENGSIIKQRIEELKLLSE